MRSMAGLPIYRRDAAFAKRDARAPEARARVTRDRLDRRRRSRIDRTSAAGRTMAWARSVSAECRCSYATKQQQQGDRVGPGLRKALFTPHPAPRVERGHVPPALHVETSCRARRQSSYGPKRCSGELVLFRRHGGAGSWLPLDSAGSYYGLVWFPQHTIPEKEILYA